MAGPGGADYRCEEVKMYDFARKPYGYWLFEPAGEGRPDSAQVVVLIHGYGALNPLIYGDWIKHLVRKGHIVIYPRYQRNLFFPRPPRFGEPRSNQHTTPASPIRTITAPGASGMRWWNCGIPNMCSLLTTIS